MFNISVEFVSNCYAVTGLWIVLTLTQNRTRDLSVTIIIMIEEDNYSRTWWTNYTIRSKSSWVDWWNRCDLMQDFGVCNYNALPLPSPQNFCGRSPSYPSCFSTVTRAAHMVFDMDTKDKSGLPTSGVENAGNLPECSLYVVQVRTGLSH